LLFAGDLVGSRTTATWKISPGQLPLGQLNAYESNTKANKIGMVHKQTSAVQA